MAEHEAGLLRYAERMLRNPFEAQDIVQNVFIKLFRGWHAGTSAPGNLKAWLYRATHNEAVDHIRRESRLRRLHDASAGEADLLCAGGAGGGASESERHEIALEHMARLDPRERQVLLLRLEEGLSYRDISRITGRSEGNVGNILHHAVRKLSASLRKAGVVTA